MNTAKMYIQTDSEVAKMLSNQSQIQAKTMYNKRNAQVSMTQTEEQHIANDFKMN